jgi:hypothetical protein
MRLYKRARGSNWSYEIQIDGRQIRKSTKTPNKAEAKRVAEREIEQLKSIAKQARAIGQQPMTFRLVAEVWWERRMADSNEPDLLVWKDWCVDQLGPAKMVADIDRADIEELIARRRNHGRVKAGRDEKGKQLYRPITLTTINRTVPRLMRRILNYSRCSLRQQVQFIPWSEVIKKPPKRPIRELSLSEEEKLETVERPEVMAVRRSSWPLVSGLRRLSI